MSILGNTITASIADPVNTTGGNNEMPVRKYKDKYEIAVPAGRYDSGRIKYKRELADTEEEAYSREKELLVEIQNLQQELKKVDFSNGKKRCSKQFKEVAGKWLMIKKRDIAPRTWERYDGILKNHILPIFGKKQMSDITEDEIRDYFIMHKNSGTTLQQHHTIMRGIFGLEDIDVMRKIKRPRKNEPEIDCIKDPVELAKFVTSFKNSILYLPVYIAAVTGMRLSEIAGLRWEDVNLEKGYITVNRSLHWSKDEKTGERKWYVKSPKNKRSKRTITISKHDIVVLKEFKQKNNASNKDFVCIDSNKNPLAKDSVSGNFKARAKTRGYDICFHSLRHSHATILIQHFKKSIGAVSKRLGHAKETTTISIYTSVLPNEDGDIAITMGEIFANV